MEKSPHPHPSNLDRVNVYVAKYNTTSCIRAKYINTKLSIFYFNCQHFLFVYIVQQKSAGFINFFWGDFQNLMEIEFCWRLIFESSINLPCRGLVRPRKKMGQIGSAVCRRFLDTNRQSSKECI